MEQRHIRTTMVKLIDRIFTEKFVRDFLYQNKTGRAMPYPASQDINCKDIAYSFILGTFALLHIAH